MTSPLYKLMNEALPPMTYQRRLQYRPSYREVGELYRIINRTLFNNELSRPELDIRPRLQRYYGMCVAHWEKVKSRNTHCKIILLDKWPSKSWLIAVLAHEMCHQYTWDIERPIRESIGKKGLMSHGPTFFNHKEKLAEHGIPLSRHMSMDKWFKCQTF